MKKKLALGFLTFITAFTVTTSAYADVNTGNPSRNPAYQQLVEAKKNVKPDEVRIQGAKGYLVKLALQSIEWAIRNGGDLVGSIIKWLDADTAKVFKANSSKISDAVAKVSKAIDDASNYVSATIRELLYNALTKAGIKGKYALPIADAITTVVATLAF